MSKFYAYPAEFLKLGLLLLPFLELSIMNFRDIRMINCFWQASSVSYLITHYKAYIILIKIWKCVNFSLYNHM